MTASDDYQQVCAGGYVGPYDERQGPDRATCPSCGRSITFHRTTGKFRRHKPPRVLRGTWDDPAIVGDPRIADQDVLVRTVAQKLHSNESMHLHQYIGSVICPYCALRASRVLRWAAQANAGQPLTHDTPWGLVASQSGRSDHEGEPCPTCGHRLSAYDWCPSCLAHVSGSSEGGHQ